MRFIADESYVYQLIMGYLKDRGLFETLSSLKLETNLAEADENLGDELLFLQRLTLQGRWDDVLDFVRPLDQVLHSFHELEYVIKRQQLLEALSWQGGGVHRHALMPWKPPKHSTYVGESSVARAIEDQDIDVDATVQLLQALERLCPKEEFQSLCQCLTLERLSDNKDFADWTVSKGRLECFSRISALIAEVIQGRPAVKSDAAAEEGSSGLQTMLAMGLAYQLAVGQGLRQSRSVDSIMTAHITNSGTAAEGLRGSRVLLLAEGVSASDLPTPLPSLKLINPVRNQMFAEPWAQPSSTPADRGAVRSQRQQQQQSVQRQPPQQQQTLRSSQDNSTTNATDLRQSFERRMEIGLSEEKATAPPPPPQTSQQIQPQLQSQLQPQAAAFFVPAAAPSSAPSVPSHEEEHISAVSTAGRPLPLVVDVHRSYTNDAGIDHQPIVDAPPTASTQATEQTYITVDTRYTQPVTAPPSTGGSKPAPVVWTVDMAANGGGGGGGNSGGEGGGAAAKKGRSLSAGRPGRQRVITGPPPLPVDGNRGGGYDGDTSPRNPHHENQGYSQQHFYNQNRPADSPARVSNSAAASPSRRGGHPIGSPHSVKSAARAQGIPVQPTTAISTAPGPSSVTSNRSGSAPPSSRTRSQLPTPKSTSTNAARRQAASQVQAVNATSMPDQQSEGPSSVGRGMPKDIIMESPSRGSKAHGGSGHPAHSSPSGARSKHVRSFHGDVGEGLVVCPWEERPHGSQPAHPGRLQQPADCEGDEMIVQVTALYEMETPVRCISLISDRMAGGGGGSGRDAEFEFAIGTNARSVKHMKYTPVHTHSSRREPLSPGAASAFSNITDASAFTRGPPVHAMLGKGSATLISEFQEVHKGSVYCMDWYGDGRLLATSSNDKAVRLINIDSGAMSQPMRGHTGTVRVLKFRNGDVGPVLAASAGGGDCQPRLWDVSTGSLYAALTAHAEAVHGLTWVSPYVLLSGCERGRLVAHDIRASGPAWSIDLSADPFLANGGGAICCLESTSSTSSSGTMRSSGADMNIAIAGCTGGLVAVINSLERRLITAQRLHSDDVRGLSVFEPPVHVHGGPSSRSGSSSSSSGGIRLLTTSFDSTGSIWRLGQSSSSGGQSQPPDTAAWSFKRLATLRGHTDKVLGAAIVPHSQQVVTTGADGRTILWTALPVI